jgi:hypothetical protein
VLDADALNAHTLSWVDSVNDSGAALVTPSLLDGTWSVRVSIGAEPTERHDVERLWGLLRQAAESGGLPPRRRQGHPAHRCLVHAAEVQPAVVLAHAGDLAVGA